MKLLLFIEIISFLYTPNNTYQTGLVKMKWFAYKCHLPVITEETLIVVETFYPSSRLDN